jgi:hypothetical protein
VHCESVEQVGMDSRSARVVGWSLQCDEVCHGLDSAFDFGNNV